MSKHSIRTGSASSSSASRRSLSASTRCSRRRWVRSLSCSSASRALRSASSYSRRFSPRRAWRSSTGASRRSSSSLAHASASASEGGPTISAGIDSDGRVVLDRELLRDLVLAAPGAVLEVEALAVGEHAVAHLEHLRVRVRALDRDGDHVERADRLVCDPLALEQRPHRPQPVAEDRRLLELLRLRGVLHALPRGRARSAR